MRKTIFKCYGLSLFRNTNKYIGLLFLSLGILVLFACGGGGDGGVGEGILPIPAEGPVISSEDDVTLSKLVGTYILMDFEATYANGDTLTWDDVSTISGTMIIKSNGEITQTIEMNGTTVTVTGTILEVQNDSMRCESGGCEFNLGIELSEDTLTTTFPIGTCGSNYTEIDVWKKQTAASIQMEGLNQQLLLDNDEVEAIPGGGFGGLYKYLP